MNYTAPKNNLFEFEELFRFYYPRLKKYAQYFLRNSGEAEDVVQDVFYQLWKERNMLKQDENISSFVFTLLKNKCLNIIKRRLVEEKYLDQLTALPSEELYHTSFEKAEDFIPFEELLNRELCKLIEQMPEKCGIAFRLKWIDGKKNREIAEEMQISTTMVDKHLAKGFSIAREKLNPNLFLLFLLITETINA